VISTLRWYEICGINDTSDQNQKSYIMKKIFVVLSLCLMITGLRGQDRFTDPRDGNEYSTITVQGMTWMAENLRYKAGEGAYYFDNDPNNIPIYGVLYDWKTAISVCPDGWHLPSGEEFHKLVNFNEQKERWTYIASEPASFRIQLAGMKDHEGTYTEMDESGYYWTSTEYDKDFAEYFSYLLITKDPVVDISRKEDTQDVHGSEKSNKYSVRCVKNQ
jgi:uncharacterized protein (TIGR02145 family)